MMLKWSKKKGSCEVRRKEVVERWSVVEDEEVGSDVRRALKKIESVNDKLD